MRNLRGAILVETLISLFIVSLIGAALFNFFLTGTSTPETLRVSNKAITDGREPIDTIADHIRNAQQYTPDGTTYTVISAASPTSITYYVDAAGATVQYTLNGTNLQRIDSSGTTTVLTNLTALNIRYYLSNSSTTYYFTDLTEGTTPGSFSLVDRSRITVVDISGTVTISGVARSFNTQIRLRNSPRKTKL
jgi:Tfp pilus assembly protein PilW